MRVLLGNSILFTIAIILLSCIGLNSYSTDHLDSSLIGSNYSDESTNFTSSGGSGLAVSGEPGYVGDTLVASMMVTNSGNSSGDVSLIISPISGDEIFQGIQIPISPGSTREVFTPFKLSSSGTNNFDWRVSVVDDPDNLQLQGSFSVEVMPSQVINLSIDTIEWTNSGGLNFDASIFLSNGKSRGVILEASSGSQGSYQLLQSIHIASDPGRRTITFDLGHPSADKVILEAIPIGWSPSSDSVNSSQMNVSEPLVNIDSILVEASFTPERPIPGDRVLASIFLENMGNYQAQSGFVRVISSSEQKILSETEVQSVMPGSNLTTDVSLLDWPASDSVVLEVQWHTSGIKSSNYYSIEADNSQEGLKLPFDILAAGYGLLAGVLTILVGTLVWRAVSTRTPSTSDFNLRETKESAKSQSKQEKTEIQCSYCDQRLMVPHNHSGGVRCPACSMEFVFGVNDKSSHPVVRSLEDTLNCPECEQALRVKVENRPAMSRCPLCKTEFMAEAGGP
jgi:hypothetical protein